MNRRGFTIIEMLIVVIIIGILATMAVLKYIDLRNHATAAAIARDVETVRVGAYSYWADHEVFPAETGDGVVPPTLENYLPHNFEFARQQYTYDWDNFGGGGGGYEVGITVTMADADLRKIVMRMFSNQLPYFQHGNALTYIIVGPDGRM